MSTDSPENPAPEFPVPCVQTILAALANGEMTGGEITDHFGQDTFGLGSFNSPLFELLSLMTDNGVLTCHIDNESIRFELASKGRLLLTILNLDTKEPTK